MTEVEARLTIDLDAMAANYAFLRRQADGAETAAVVKADAYGLGLISVARRLRAEGAQSFFVARVGEGERLRRALGGAAAIYVLDGCPPGAAARLAAAELTPVLNSLDQALDWGRRPAASHVDTGLNRLGVSLTEARSLADSAFPATLLISHLSCADAPTHPMNGAQQRAFAALRPLFPRARASLANSGGLFLGKGYHFDLVRPGITLYGGGPFDAHDPRIRHVATLEAPILQVRETASGATIGYGAACVMTKAARIAIVAAGHADGVLRAACPAGFAWFAGARRAMLGRISMDLIAIDVTGCEEAHPGALVELLGPHCLVDEVAAAAGTISYEVLTRLSTRAVRVWRGDEA